MPSYTYKDGELVEVPDTVTTESCEIHVRTEHSRHSAPVDSWVASAGRSCCGSQAHRRWPSMIRILGSLESGSEKLVNFSPAASIAFR